MRSVPSPLILAVALVSLPSDASAEAIRLQLPDVTAALKFSPAPGFEAAQTNCTVCHSVDYIITQPPKMGPAFWNAEVQKMIKVYKASIDEADVKTIADYLNANY